MGISDNIKNLATNIQEVTTRTSISLSQRILRLISGFFIGLVLALITQELSQSGLLMMLFLTTVFMLIIYKLLSKLFIFQILIFDLVCILIAALIRMYILIAP